MFAIYDVNGRYFRDTLEQFRKVQKITSSHRTTFGQDSEELLRQSSSNSFDDSKALLKADQAYRSVLNISERELILHAYQVMTHPVETIKLTLRLSLAWELFEQQNHYQLPVVNNLQQIVGMLSESELLRFIVLSKGAANDWQNKTVADVMSSQVVTADPVSDVRRIATVMLDYDLNALPIVDERDVLVGLVSRRDLLKALSNVPPLNLWS
ncbi:MAG: acetoin utilization protein AcuB [Oleiphilaceae bacterium]|jgi:acetoin utilization protein AcuB